MTRPLPQLSPEAVALHNDCLIFDLHCDTLLSQALYGYNPARRHQNRLPLSPLTYQSDIPRLKEGGVGAVALGIVTNPLRGNRALSSTRRALMDMQDWPRRAPEDVRLISTAADIEAARKADQIALFGGLEGAHGLGGSLDQLAELRELGLRYIGLAHFSRNFAATPAFGWGADPNAALSDSGRELVEEMNRLGMIVDLAHLNRAGFMETCQRSKAPVMVSHTGVAGASQSWRNIDDTQLRAVAESGGVIGIIFAPIFLGPTLTGSAELIVAHIQHVINVVGEEHVAIGSDFDGFIIPPSDLPDHSYMPYLTELMLQSGMTEAQIRKCLGANTLRVFREVCG
ncbi:MAG: peptidase [Rickettsiales bacterium]|nr:peptidase [Rickettsiales bacterium]|tara:strand:+ start:2726 stop:3751 length:1026 start_codon:yes stop_codon:yes gene_type:complete